VNSNLTCIPLILSASALLSVYAQNIHSDYSATYLDPSLPVITCLDSVLTYDKNNVIVQKDMYSYGTNSLIRTFVYKQTISTEYDTAILHCTLNDNKQILKSVQGSEISTYHYVDNALILVSTFDTISNKELGRVTYIRTVDGLIDSIYLIINGDVNQIQKRNYVGSKLVSIHYTFAAGPTAIDSLIYDSTLNIISSKLSYSYDLAISSSFYFNDTRIVSEESVGSDSSYLKSKYYYSSSGINQKNNIVKKIKYSNNLSKFEYLVNGRRCLFASSGIYISNSARKIIVK
jgi:hypothetical protein